MESDSTNKLIELAANALLIAQDPVKYDQKTRMEAKIRAGEIEMGIGMRYQSIPNRVLLQMESEVSNATFSEGLGHWKKIVQLKAIRIALQENKKPIRVPFNW